MAFTGKILIADNEADFARLSAEVFVGILESIDQPLVTLPTGLTPLGFYEELVTNHAHKRDLWEQLRFIALDEYVGLSAGDERLFAAWLARIVLDPLGIQNRILFDSAADPESEATRIQNILEREGPLDIAVLGLGANGHIGFNEPGTAFTRQTHVMTLTPDSVQSNARYWGGADRVPQQGITLGLHDMAQAHHTILLVKGAGKADILKQSLQSPVTPEIPATYLQNIKNVTIIADLDAASAL